MGTAPWWSVRQGLAGLVIGWLAVASVASAQPQDGADAANSRPRPNILWISTDDHGQEMGCYGDPLATTPHVDALAQQGMLFRHVWSNAAVCAPARTAIITGMYPTSLGAEHMRSYVPMPVGHEFFTQRLQRHGYYCTNNNKEDYNVATPTDLWNESSRRAHYLNRAEGQPFFAVFNSGVAHESQIWNLKGEPKHSPAEVRVPAYHPDTAEVRRDWAIYYDRVSQADAVAGERLKELANAGLTDSTIVFYWADHGSGMPRHKRRPTSTGLDVPLVVYIPEQFADLRPDDYAPGAQSQRLVSFVDFAPTVLSLAGIQPPEEMQGRAFLGLHAGTPVAYLHGFRGRMDERLDLVRSVTNGRFVYVKNYMPHVPEGQLLTYQLQTPTTRLWLEKFRRGELNEVQARFWQSPKASEELYDLSVDRDEVNNLVGDPAFADVLDELRQAHRDHVLAVRDLGFYPEGLRLQVAGDRAMPEAFGGNDEYPIAEVLQAAWLASSIEDTTAETIDRLCEIAGNAHPVLRYWGVLGLVMRGQPIVEQEAELLSRVLERDPLPLIQAVAARGLLTASDASIRDQAIERLLVMAGDKDQELFTATVVFDALEQLGADAARYNEQIDRLSDERVSPHKRYDTYLPRLLDFLRQAAGLPARE